MNIPIEKQWDFNTKVIMAKLSNQRNREAAFQKINAKKQRLLNTVCPHCQAEGRVIEDKYPGKNADKHINHYYYCLSCKTKFNKPITI